MANAKRIGWAIYAVGFVIWAFWLLEHRPLLNNSLGRGHAVVDFEFHSEPRSRTRTCAHVRECNPDLWARSMGQLSSLICLRGPSSLRGRDPHVVGVLAWLIWRVI